MEELRKLMCIPAEAGKEEIKDRFEKIAEIFKNKCVIKYDEKEYRILDFEFYYYNKEHPDISVHPRKSKALCWYVNDFGGIDLNFESDIEKEFVENKGRWSFKYKLTDKSYFGGILIRQIQERGESKKVFDGPWKVADLFRVLDATTQTQKTPMLVLKENLEPIKFKAPEKRYNLLGKRSAKEKADYNLQECFLEISDSKKCYLEDKLAKFRDSPYRYCWIKKS